MWLVRSDMRQSQMTRRGNARYSVPLACLSNSVCAAGIGVKAGKARTRRSYDALQQRVV